MNYLRPVIVFVGILALWQALVSGLSIAPFILPGPLAVLDVAIDRADTIAGHALVTLSEILLGLLFGTLLGTFSALVMAYSPSHRCWCCGSATGSRPRSRWRP